MQYTDELKADALLMMQQGTKIAEVSQLLNIPASTLYRWRSERKPDPKSEQASEVAQLQEQVAQLKAQVQEFAVLEGQLREVLTWAERKMREEAKERERRDYEQGEDKPRLVFGKR